MDDGRAVKQAGVSMLSGMLVGAAWWIFIDGYASCPADLDCGPTTSTQGYAWVPLAFATIVFVMINGMKWSELRDDISGDAKTAAKARIFLVFAMMMGIGCMAGSGFIMSDKFLRAETGYKWAGISGFVGTLLILAAAFVMRFGTMPPADFA